MQFPLEYGIVPVLRKDPDSRMAMVVVGTMDQDVGTTDQDMGTKEIVLKVVVFRRVTYAQGLKFCQV